MIDRLSPLQTWQQVHKTRCTPPERGIISWILHMIEDFEKKESIVHNLVYARIMKRIIAAAMPIFAFLDGARFLGKAIGKAVALKPKDAFYELSRCAASLELF